MCGMRECLNEAMELEKNSKYSREQFSIHVDSNPFAEYGNKSNPQTLISPLYAWKLV